MPSIRKLEQKARDIGKLIMKGLPKNVGFTLVLFDFGVGGNMTYVSNGRRLDILNMLKELHDKISDDVP